MAVGMQPSPAMKYLGCVLAIAALAGGCGTATRSAWVYDRPGTTEAQLRQDSQGCLLESVGTPDVRGLSTYAETLSREAFNECMRQRGYAVRSGTAAAMPR